MSSCFFNFKENGVNGVNGLAGLLLGEGGDLEDVVDQDGVGLDPDHRGLHPDPGVVKVLVTRPMEGQVDVLGDECHAQDIREADGELLAFCVLKEGVLLCKIIY